MENKIDFYILKQDYSGKIKSDLLHFDTKEEFNAALKTIQNEMNSDYEKYRDFRVMGGMELHHPDKNVRACFDFIDLVDVNKTFCPMLITDYKKIAEKKDRSEYRDKIIDIVADSVAYFMPHYQFTSVFSSNLEMYNGCIIPYDCNKDIMEPDFIDNIDRNKLLDPSISMVPASCADEFLIEGEGWLNPEQLKEYVTNNPFYRQPVISKVNVKYVDREGKRGNSDMTAEAFMQLYYKQFGLRYIVYDYDPTKPFQTEDGIEFGNVIPIASFAKKEDALKAGYAMGLPYTTKDSSANHVFVIDKAYHTNFICNLENEYCLTENEEVVNANPDLKPYEWLLRDKQTAYDAEFAKALEEQAKTLNNMSKKKSHSR